MNIGPRVISKKRRDGGFFSQLKNEKHVRNAARLRAPLERIAVPVERSQHEEKRGHQESKRNHHDLPVSWFHGHDLAEAKTRRGDSNPGDERVHDPERAPSEELDHTRFVQDQPERAQRAEILRVDSVKKVVPEDHHHTDRTNQRDGKNTSPDRKTNDQPSDQSTTASVRSSEKFN